MKKQLIHLTSLFLLAAFAISFIPASNAEKETSCNAEEEMTCCAMDDMEMSSCECPEMTRQDKPQKEKTPAIPVTIVNKITAKHEYVVIKDLTIPVLSKRVFNFINSAHYSTLSNKIYKKTNTFHI